MARLPIYVALAACTLLTGCTPAPAAVETAPTAQRAEKAPTARDANGGTGTAGAEAPTEEPATASADRDDAKAPAPAVEIVPDLRPSLSHGPKPAANQRYIVLHDTEGTAGPSEVVDWWDSTGTYVAAHFVVGRDGSVVQCVDLDAIAHHAGYGDAGHNGLFGIAEDGRDDMRGTAPIGSWAPDYAMNAWSVGIELVHTGGQDYPEAQLEALDALIAHIDGHFGFESTVTDHKAWRTGNSDTSPEFAGYLEHYRTSRTHDGN